MRTPDPLLFSTRSIGRYLVVALLLILLTACGGLAGEPEIVATLPPVPTQPPAASAATSLSTAPDIATGAQIFAARCVDCHGEKGDADSDMVRNGQLTVTPTDMTNPLTTRNQSPAQWFSTITTGRMDRLMPPWSQALNEQQRWDVALYTYTLAYQAGQLANGQAVWEANCARCHGATGQGDRADAPIGIPDLSTPDALLEISDAALFDVVTQGQGQMPGFADTLDEAQRWDAIAYTRTLALSNTDSIGAVVSPSVMSPTEQAAAPPDGTTVAQESSAATPDSNARVPGTVSGQVTHETPGSSVPADLKITLTVLDLEGGQEDYETTINADGSYQFADVSFFAPADYIVTTTYQDRVFGRGQGIDDTSNTALDLPLTIFDVTTDPNVIEVTGMVYQIIDVPGGIQVTQVMTIANTSDKVYTSDESFAESRYYSIGVALPVGAELIDVDNPRRYLLSEDNTTLYDTQAVYPGEDHNPIHLIYFLPHISATTIEQKLAHPVNGAVRVLLQPESLSITSAQLPSLGPEMLRDVTYQSYGGDLSLPAGETIRFEVRGDITATGSSASSSAGISTETLLAIVLFVVGVVIILVAVVFYFRRGRESGAADDQRLIDGLIRQIAELDEAYETGELKKKAYQKQRHILKTRLAELMDD